MSPTYYVDTAYHAAVIDSRDRLHLEALRLANRLANERTATFVTSEAVIIELLTFS